MLRPQPQNFRATTLHTNSILLGVPASLAVKMKTAFSIPRASRSPHLAQRRASINSAFLKWELVGEGQTAPEASRGELGKFITNPKHLHAFLPVAFSLVEEYLLCLRKPPNIGVLWRCPNNTHIPSHFPYLTCTAVWKGTLVHPALDQLGN